METFKRTLIILLAAGIVFAAMMPLAQTDWAEETRSGFVGEDESSEATRDPKMDMPAGLGFFMGFIKETVIMLVSGMVTLGIYRLVKGRSRSKKARASAG